MIKILDNVYCAFYLQTKISSYFANLLPKNKFFCNNTKNKSNGRNVVQKVVY